MHSVTCSGRLGLVAGLVALMFGSATPDAQLQNRYGRFKSGTELVALNVTATDRQERFVANLRAEDFAVFEDGVPQEICFFADGEVPLDLIVLLDTSSSMASKWSAARRAAVGFIRTLGANDRGAVVGFARRASVLQGLTGDLPALVAAVEGAGADGTTALYTAIYVALKEFGRPARHADEMRRQALVVLSDGYDTASPLPFDALLDEARRTGVAIYTIGLESQPGLRAKLDGQASAARYTMRALAQETGARAFFPRDVRELDGIADRIGAELAHQYAIAYAPPVSDRAAGLRSIAVRMTTRSGVRLRTRTGYLAERAASSASDR